jgi:hypothetical protein
METITVLPAGITAQLALMLPVSAQLAQLGSSEIILIRLFVLNATSLLALSKMIRKRFVLLNHTVPTEWCPHSMLTVSK